MKLASKLIHATNPNIANMIIPFVKLKNPMQELSHIGFKKATTILGFISNASTNS